MMLIFSSFLLWSVIQNLISGSQGAGIYKGQLISRRQGVDVARQFFEPHPEAPIDNAVCDFVDKSECSEIFIKKSCPFLCELASTCSAGQFECKPGECIDKTLRCDGKIDCMYGGGGMDEVDCPKKPISACPVDWFTIGSECFKIFGGPQVNKLWWRDWSSADAHCKSIGGYLAEPKDTKGLADYIRVNGQTNIGYWLGGSDMTNEGDWLWNSGDPVSYELFARHRHQPDDVNAEQNCLGIWGVHGRESLYDYYCGRRTPFACERDL